jgi:hypothetical protein
MLQKKKRLKSSRNTTHIKSKVKSKNSKGFDFCLLNFDFEL